MSSPALLPFYRGEAPDARGRMLAGILAWDDAQLEIVHNYIQWLFPLPERSAFNPAAPILTPDDIAAFGADRRLRANLLTALRRMLAFYGLSLNETGSGPMVRRAPDFAHQTGNWLKPGNHNLLRLTRIMRSLASLGLPDHARALQSTLLDIAANEGCDAVSETTLAYWRDATSP